MTALQLARDASKKVLMTAATVDEDGIKGPSSTSNHKLFDAEADDAWQHMASSKFSVFIFSLMWCCLLPMT